MKKILFVSTLIFIIVEFIAFWEVEDFHNTEINQYLEKQTDVLAVKLNTAQKAYILVSKNIFEEDINQPQILKLYSKASDADSAEQANIRDSLYNLLLPTFNYLKLTYIKQLHFHLPNNHSFLRFHRPAKFGDDLSNIRYSVKMTNQTHKNYYGFEVGKIYNGFRNVFPLFYDNKYIGSVETSFSFDAIKLQLQQYENVIYGLMLKKEVVNKKVFKDEQNNYIQSLFSENYLYEKKYKHYSTDSILNKQLEKAVSDEITDNLANNNNFSISKKLKGKYYLLSFVSTKNVEGKPVAYLFSYKEDETIVKYISSNLRIHIISSLLIAIIFLLIFITLSRNNKIIENEKRMTTMADAVNDAIILINNSEEIAFWNRGAENIFGYTEKEIIGKNLHEILPPPEFRPITHKAFTRFKNTGKGNALNKTLELTAVRKNGALFPIELSLSPLKLKNKWGAVGIIRDITERKKAEQALKDSEAKLKESNATKDKFFSIIAHDLKSPFNAILGFSNLLVKNHTKYDVKKRDKMVKIVNDSAINAFKLLENLLTWSRSQSGKISFSPEKLYLKILLSEIIFDLQGQAKKKEIKVLDAISENCEIFADKNMLATVLRNLISNAIKFTNKNGEIKISAKQNDKNIIISVADNGVGINKVKLNKIFDISEKTSTQGTENEKGTGLGLALCKEFAEKQGGKIWVESEEGQGSTFYFTIPNKQTI